MNIQPSIDLKKVNLQSAVGYLISLHDNEVDWNLLGIKVIGHIDALPIPEGTYEYGDAYMVGTETPYDMYVYSRPDGAVHTEGYWFPIGKFPMPGPAGKDGSPANITALTTTNNTVTYDSTDGAHIVGTTTMSYKNDAGEIQTSSYPNEFYVPIAAADEYLTMDVNPSNTGVDIKLDKPSLALDFYEINKPTNGKTSIPAWDGTKVVYLPYSKDEKVGYANALVKTNSTGEITINRINFAQRVGGASSVFQFGNNTYYVQHFFQDNVTKDISINTSATNSGTVSGAILDTLIKCKNVNVLYRGYSHIRQTPVTNNGVIKYVSTEYDNNIITVMNFVVNTSSGEWTWTQTSFYPSSATPTYKHVTQMHVVIPGDDDYYLTIFTTDKHGAMYNLNSASTLLDNIGTAGTIAYKQNTANGVYMPAHVSKNASGNWAWNMGSASGTFTTNQIDLITDDYETIG